MHVDMYNSKPFCFSGAKDISRIKTTTPLVEMGLDSLMGTEIRQVFARRFDLQLSVGEVQNLTLDGVKALFES